MIQTYIPNQKNVTFSANLILFEVQSQDLLTTCDQFYNQDKLQLKIIAATDELSTDKCLKIFYIFGLPGNDYFLAPFIKVPGGGDFPSIVSKIHQALSYEREIQSFFGLKPVGHLNSQQFLLHEDWPGSQHPLRKDFNYQKRPAKVHGKYQFQIVEGEGIYEIPVGPVHAGIIEPGHFRFSVAGEEIISLQPKLGYVHKGIEKLFEVLPLDQKIQLAERVSGDSSFSHSLAFCQALEKLANISVPKRGQQLRVIFAELERLANHLNDIAFIMTDTGFSFGGSQGTRLREAVCQLNEKLTGHRFLRGVNIIGGVTKDLTQQQQEQVVQTIQALSKDFAEVIDISESNSSVINRLKGTGVLDTQVALDHGVVGIAAKASGIPRDTRIEYPYAAYQDVDFKIAGQSEGDVYARFEVRIQEVASSIQIMQKVLRKLANGPILFNKPHSLAKNSAVISLVEGWRGEIVYFVQTDHTGQISRVALRDPSYLNWPAVPYAVAGNVVPDFPLINKSFNLSYSGHDK